MMWETMLPCSSSMTTTSSSFEAGLGLGGVFAPLFVEVAAVEVGVEEGGGFLEGSAAAENRRSLESIVREE